MPDFRVLLPALLPLWGCFLPTSREACDAAPSDSSGELTFGDTRHTPTLDWFSMDAERDAGCVSAVMATLGLGDGCTLGFVAEGASPRLQVDDIGIGDEEACGLEGSGWTPVHLDDTWVEDEGEVTYSLNDSTMCYDGVLTLKVDTTLEREGSTVDVVGEITMTGPRNARAVDATCD